MARTHEIVARLRAEGQQEYVAGVQEGADTTEQFAATAEETEERVGASWERIRNVTAGAMAAFGGGLEAINRSQQDVRDVSARVGNAIGETQDTVLEAAADMNNATRDVDELTAMMETGSQRGIRSIEGLQDFAATWDTISDATGEAAPQLAEASTALNAVDIAADETEEAMAALGFVTQNSIGTIGDFLRLVERAGRELGDQAPHINEMAALLGVLEDQGLRAQQAQREVQQELRRSEGDMDAAREALGITTDTYERYIRKVEGSSGVIDANAASFAENRTTIQAITSEIESLTARYSGLLQSLEPVAPVAMTAAGALYSFNAAKSAAVGAAQTLQSNWGTLSTRGRRLARLVRGPLTGAFVAAVPVITAFAEAHADGAETVDSLRNALDETAASTKTLTDQWLISELESRNLLAAFNDLDMNLSDLRQALLGNGDAYEELQDQIVGAMSATDHLRGVLYITSGTTIDLRNDSLRLYHTLGDLRSGTRTYNEELAAQRDLTGQTASESEGAESALEEMRSSLEDARQQATEFTDALDALTSPALGVEQAVLGWDDALVSLSGTLAENEATLSRQNEEGRENRRAILDVVQAAQKHASAMIENGVSTEQATGALTRHVRELRREMAQAGLSEQAIDNYIDTLNLTPTQIETTILSDTGPATSEVEGWRRDVTSQPPVPIGVGADTQPARAAIGGLRNWILSRGVIDMSMNLSGFEQGGPGEGVLPPGGSPIDRLTGFMASTGLPHRVTSTLRPGDDGYHGLGRAVDFAGPSPGVDTPELRAIQQAFAPLGAAGVLRELIGPNPALNFKNGIQGPGVYPADVREAHKNHTHTAMWAGGMIREPILGVGQQTGASYSFGERGDEFVTPVIDAMARSTTVATAPGTGAVDGPASRVIDHSAEPIGDTIVNVSVNVDGDVLDPKDWFDEHREAIAEAVATAVEDHKARR